MHQYLKAIGFEQVSTRKELKEILKETREKASHQEVVGCGEGRELRGYLKEYSENVGIILCGEMDEPDDFEMEYYFPYFVGSGVTSYEDVSVERRIDREMYIGVCEDVRIGITLIFHLINNFEYQRERRLGQISRKSVSVTLSCMALGGIILLPLQKSELHIRESEKEARNRMMLLAAAKNGDERAIESLTLDDMDIYSKISRKIMTEDVYTVVETYLMPYGAECDQYSILGEIIDIREAVNEKTGSELYLFTLNVNELKFDVCVPKAGVLGIPEKGRRFKANVWMQGVINF